MSQVHNLTHVPVHSPLSEACLPYLCASAHANYQGGRCGQEQALEVGAKTRNAAEAREETSSRDQICGSIALKSGRNDKVLEVGSIF
jgi:hypothetical protein